MPFVNVSRSKAFERFDVAEASVELAEAIDSEMPPTNADSSEA